MGSKALWSCVVAQMHAFHAVVYARNVAWTRAPQDHSTLTTPTWLQVLLAAAVDSWAPLRASVLAALRALPRPLPGLERPEAVEALACWALRLLRSPRPFEAAAASQLLSLLHDAYALGLGWHIRVHPTAAVCDAPADSATAARTGAGLQGTRSGELTVKEARRAGVIAPVGLRASVAFLASVVEAVEAAVAVAERDMAAACRESFLQGPLLLLQALLSAFPWAAVMPLGNEVCCVLCTVAVGLPPSGSYTARTAPLKWEDVDSKGWG